MSSSSTLSTGGGASPSQKFRLFFAVFFVPYLFSYLLTVEHIREIVSTYVTGGSSSDQGSSSETIFPEDAAAATSRSAPGTYADVAGPPSLSPNCERRFRSIMGLLGQTETFKRANIEFHLHRNGDPNPCGKTTGAEFLEELKNHYARFEDGCRPNLNKYQVESLLTSALYSLTETSCASIETDGVVTEGLLGFCDMGEAKTPILPDYEDLVPVPVPSHDKNSKQRRYLPCRFHTREGQRISQLKQLSDMVLFQNKDGVDDARVVSDNNNNNNDDETSSPRGGVQKTSNTRAGRDVHLYAVPAGRVFMFAPAYVGEIFNLSHVAGVHDEPIYLEVLSLEPRVFDIYNFFSRDESQELVEKAINEKSPSHKIKRSTTGAGMYGIVVLGDDL